MFTPEWEAWTVNRREVPLAGTWSVFGHEPGSGAIRGQLLVRRTGEDSYTTEWRLEDADGEVRSRQGKAIVYAGYSWRGRSTPRGSAEGQPAQLKEVLLLDDDWNRMKGRLFTGAYHEFGIDVELHRHIGLGRVLGVVDGAIPIPAAGHVVEVIGETLPEEGRRGRFPSR